MIEKLLKEEYWPMGYFCVVDWGEASGEKPDIAVLKPSVREIKDKLGNELRMPTRTSGTTRSTTAVEVEMSPQKNKEQVLKNYRKNKGVYA